MNSSLEEHFHARMLNIYYVVFEQTRYPARRFKQKVDRVGGLQAAKDWLRPNVRQLAGLDRLASLKRLDLSFEALVLQAPWSQLFSDAELQVARRRLNLVAGEILPEETSDTLLEGATVQTVVNRHERNREARRQCIQHYGTSCFVCHLNMSDLYGEVAEGFIHVHHLTPVSARREQYEVDPIRDLRPVCPNCHAIIHLGGQTRSVEAVQGMLKVNPLFSAVK